MLSVLRTLLVSIYCILVCVIGCIWCLFSPRNPRHVATFSHIFGKLHKLFGVDLELRRAPESVNIGNAIYIANHQNNFDMITCANIVQSPTVTVGKKSLLWVPFFGPLYWLTGNLLLDRDNKSKAHGLITQVVHKLQHDKISFWMFPEGTRSRGRGLLPFKAGAFHAALAAGVPIVPIVVSNTHQKIKWNRWNNGSVIVEMLPPIDTRQFEAHAVRKLTQHCRELMYNRIGQINNEIAERENQAK